MDTKIPFSLLSVHFLALFHPSSRHSKSDPLNNLPSPFQERGDSLVDTIGGGGGGGEIVKYILKIYTFYSCFTCDYV